MNEIPMHQQNKKPEKGLSLIESAMVLALATVTISSVLYFYNNALENKKVNDGISRVQSIIVAINGFLTNGSYAFNDTNTLGAFVKAVSLKTGIPTTTFGDNTTQFIDENGRGIEFWPDTTNRLYVIEVQTSNIPTCVKYASMNMGTMFSKKPEIFLNKKSMGVANDVSSANLACQNADKSRNGANIKIRYSLKY